MLNTNSETQPGIIRTICEDKYLAPKMTVGGILTGMCTIPLTDSKTVIELSTTAGIIVAPILFATGKDLYRYIATNQITQRVQQIANTIVS